MALAHANGQLLVLNRYSLNDVAPYGMAAGGAGQHSATSALESPAMQGIRHDLSSHRQLEHALGCHHFLGHHVACLHDKGGRLVGGHSDIWQQLARPWWQSPAQLWGTLN